MLVINTENFLEEHEVAELLGKKIASLRSDAARRKGPPRIKVGRKILYRHASLLDWLKDQEVDYNNVRNTRVSEDRYV